MILLVFHLHVTIRLTNCRMVVLFQVPKQILCSAVAAQQWDLKAFFDGICNSVSHCWWCDLLARKILYVTHCYYLLCYSNPVWRLVSQLGTTKPKREGKDNSNETTKIITNSILSYHYTIETVSSSMKYNHMNFDLTFMESLRL